METEETASLKTESGEEVQRVCRDGNKWSRNRAMSRAAITLQTARNHIDLRVSPRRLLRVREQCGIVMAPRECGCKAAEPICPGSQHSYLRATRTRIDADTIHIAPRETYINNFLDNSCKPMPTPIVQTLQKSDEDEPRLGEENRRAYHRCVGILRHLSKYRPDIGFAVHEVSKTLAFS